MKRFFLLNLFLCFFIFTKAQYVILLSPNGGESFAIGSSQSITWAALGINEIDIEYSNNNGTSFITIATNVSVFTNSYSWIVTGPVTSNGLIRLKESTAGVISDVSTSPFNVVNPSIQITYPTAGLIFNPAQIVELTWTAYLVSNNVTILFSSNNGLSYDTVIDNTPNFYSFNWTVPPVSSVNCKIKIIDAASSAVQNISPTFTIEALPSNGNILTPNGGETLYATNSYDITWNISGTSIIDLEYTTDGGTNWQIIGQNIPASPNSFSWTVPSVNTTNAKVRMKNAINALILDESNNFFTINQPTPILYLSSPFGYENWAVGSTQNIQWTYSFINDIKIEYSIDGGNNYTLISASTPASDLSYNWVIPSTTSTNCIVRISDNNSATTSQNQFPFNIVNPSLVLNTPNGGEVFNPNIDTLITWNGSVVSNLIKLEYTTNNGVSWNLIANNIPNANYYHWLVPNTPSTNCKVRVYDAQYPAVFDQSNANFTITPPTPVINLLAPLGGEQWGIGTYQTIFWSSNNIANLKIEYSPDSGLTWDVIDPLVPANLGTYTWLVDAIPSSNTFIKISDASNISVNDISANTIEIYMPNSFVDLLFPNSGEQLSAGINTSITWNAQSVNFVNIEFTVNNGNSWQLIANNIDASLGIYNWNVPNIISNTVKIRIRDNNNITIYDQSAGVFSIIQPSISFTGFPSGANFDLLSFLNLQWNSTGLLNQLLRLEYSTNNGINWVTFASGIPNTGAYNWLINCPPALNCKIRISVENNNSIADITSGSIQINPIGPSIVVLTPTGGENISAGIVYPIMWNSYGVNYVRLEYSLNGDTIYQLITPFTPANLGVFYWNVPANLNASNCNIRISNAANTNLSVQTSSPFNIQTGQLYMITSNFTSILTAGTNFQILWSQVATSPYVNLDYSTDSSTWTSIIAGYNNSGSYNWSVPYVNADSVWIRVQDFANNLIFDVNDMRQIIVITDSLLELSNPPNGTYLLGGSSYTINWNTYGIDLVDLEFSTDNGVSWTNIASNINAINGSYQWLVPNLATNTAFIRIKNSNYPTQFSQNQIPFTISEYFLTIASPNGNETLLNNSNSYITWQSLGIDFIDLYLSIDGGISYNIIDSNIFNLGFYNWQISGLVSNNCKIKIVDSNNDFLFDESNSTFTINSNVSSLTLNTPNGNEQVFSNTGYYITWQSSGISNIDLSYSLDGGNTYTLIASNISSLPAFYYWLVPDTLSFNAKIKISDSNNLSLNDVSNSTFSILNNVEEITLTTPNGGEIFNSFSFQLIKWNSINIPFVNIYYSTNGGVSYNFITAVYNDSSYIWNIPPVSSSLCKIKIENGNNPSMNDISDAHFTINNLPVSSNLIQIDSLPNVNFCIGASVSIPYNTTGIFDSNNQFSVHLSDPFGDFNNFTIIGTTINDTSGVIQCTIPAQLLTSNAYKLRIVADNPVTIGAYYPYSNISINKADADFSSDKQLVLFPNTLVNFTPAANSNSIATTNWNTGNGGTYNSFLAQHQYNSVGKYDITLSLTDTSGCSAQKTLLRYIDVENWFPNTNLLNNSNANIIDIAFEDEKYGCAILKNGNCLVTNDSGHTWTTTYTNTGSVLLNSIFIFNNSWFIAAENGAYYKSVDKGNSWTQNAINNYESLRDIYFVNSNNAIAVGNNGKILKYNGVSWLNQNSGTNNKLNKISYNNQKAIIVGNNGTIINNQNNSYTSVASPVNVNLNSICLKDSSVGYIVGDYGFIFKTTNGGISWSVVLSGADVNFNDIVCNNDTVWAVGNDGIIYSSFNNGQSWNRYSIDVTSDLNSIIYNQHKGYIVGNNGLLRRFNNPEFIPVISAISNEVNQVTVKGFPNPTANFVNIELNNSNSSSVSFYVYNIQGKKLFESRENTTEISSIHQIDLRSFADGVYFITVVLNGKYQTFKIVKSK